MKERNQGQMEKYFSMVLTSIVFSIILNKNCEYEIIIGEILYIFYSKNLGN